MNTDPHRLKIIESSYKYLIGHSQAGVLISYVTLKYNLVGNVLDSFLNGAEHTDSAHLCCCGKTADTQPVSEKWAMSQFSRKRVCSQKISQKYTTRSGNPLTDLFGTITLNLELISLTRTKLF